MRSSLASNPYLTESLVEFLTIVSMEYFPAHRELIQQGVDASMDLLLQKQVVR